MRLFLRFLKSIWLINFSRRILRASKYYNHRYIQILKWGFNSNEDTNYTYHLTKDNIQYLAHTLSIVCRIDFADIIGYFDELNNDDDLKKSILNSMQNSKEGRFADKEIRFGRRIGWYAIVRAMKPKVVVETGVDKGLGSVVLCSALLRNRDEGYEGKYFGTDINLEAGYYLQGRYKEVGQILYGDSIDSLKSFSNKIDLFINDSDHSAEYEYDEYLTIEPLTNKKTIILGDNSHCTDKLAKFSLKQKRDFLFFKEEPKNHWYPGAGIGISYIR